MLSSDGLTARPSYPWAALPGRRPLRWPDNSPLALVVVVAVEQFEIRPDPAATPPPSATYTSPYPRVFDGGDVLLHEYGARVGFFRLTGMLERLGIRPTIAIDALTAERCPAIVELCLDRRWEIIAHGYAGSQMITSAMTEKEERGYIRRTRMILEKQFASRCHGWFGVEYGESGMTQELLRHEGFNFVCDWPADEQPFWLDSAKSLVSLPIGGDLDDVLQHRARFVPMASWGDLLVNTARRLRTDGEINARVMGVVLNSWLSGHPFRLVHVERALRTVLQEGRLWLATAGEVVHSFRVQEVGT